MRKGRRSIPGAYYSLTLSTINRKPLLANEKVATVIFDAFDWLETHKWCRWVCLVVMPDHIHAVIQLGEDQPLSRAHSNLKEFHGETNQHLP